MADGRPAPPTPWATRRSSFNSGDADVTITGGSEAAMTRWTQRLARTCAPLRRNDEPQRPVARSTASETDRVREGAGMLVFEDWSTPASACPIDARGRRVCEPAPTPSISLNRTKQASAPPGRWPTCLVRRPDESLRIGLYQRPWHQYHARRQAETPPSNASSSTTRHEGEHFQHQKPTGHSLGASGGVELILTVLAFDRRRGCRRST